MLFWLHYSFISKALLPLGKSGQIYLLTYFFSDLDVIMGGGNSFIDQKFHIFQSQILRDPVEAIQRHGEVRTRPGEVGIACDEVRDFGAQNLVVVAL